MIRRPWRLLGGLALVSTAMVIGLAVHSRSATPAARVEASAQRRSSAPSEGFAGSAFAVAPGMLVTNAHVMLKCRSHGLPLQVRGSPGLWQIVQEDAQTDLALLTGAALPAHQLALSSATQLPRGLAVMALGYPVASADGVPAGGLRSSLGHLLRASLTVHEPEGGRANSFVVRNGQGQEVAATWDDGLRYFGPHQANRLRWLLEIDAPTANGSSGGPVLDSAGDVVGVIYAGDPQRGLTAVVPLEDLREFLLRAGVTPSFRPRPPATDLDWRRIRSDAARAVYRVYC